MNWAPVEAADAVGFFVPFRVVARLTGRATAPGSVPPPQARARGTA